MFRKDLPAKTQRREGCFDGSFSSFNREFSRAFVFNFAPLRLCGMFLFVSLCFCSCKREERKFTAPPSTFKSYQVVMSDIHPGSAGLPQPVQNQSDYRAYDTSQGKQLFTQYNCVGCHFNGGGGIGPPLMDEQWIYGDSPENIYATIVEGRPNGMPSFREKIPDSQVWQLAAYVRSMSGQLRKDVEPGRNDDMNSRRSEQRTQEKKPQRTTPGSNR